jgi:general secretion pathway protein M
MSLAKTPGLMDALSARWSALVPRERLVVGGALVLIVGALLWWIGISPALKQLKLARDAAPQLDAQLQSMRSLASEATSLKAQRALSYEESVRGLESSLKTLGTGATLSVSDARASITLRAVSGDALAQWLAQVRANARLVPNELRLKKAAGNTNVVTNWDGTIVLSLPAKP